jgi:hypothetical protein
MYNTCEEDTRVGKEEEIKVLPHLCRYFNDDGLKLVSSEWEANDYIGSSGKKYEVKTRDLKSDNPLAVEGLLINVAKVVFNNYIIWNLLDGIYVADTEEILDDADIKMKTITNERRWDERPTAILTKKVYCVPISKCRCIKKYDVLRTPKEKTGGLIRGVCHIRLDD